MSTTIQMGPAWASPSCLNETCQSHSEKIVLLHQSHLGTFDDQINPSTDTWPITYLCQKCGRTCVVYAGMNYRVVVQQPVHNRLVRYEFSNGQLDSPVRLTIYTKEKKPEQINLEDPQQAIDRILKPFGSWNNADGMPHNVGIDWLASS